MEFPPIEPQQLECLTQAIYHEARGESYHGQLMVGFIIDNRVQSDWYKNSICKVVYQPWQFSYIHELQSYTMHEQEAKERSKQVAKIVLTSYNPLPDDVLLYHKKGIKPNWDFTKVEHYVTIDNHILYREFR